MADQRVYNDEKYKTFTRIPQNKTSLTCKLSGLTHRVIARDQVFLCAGGNAHRLGQNELSPRLIAFYTPDLVSRNFTNAHKCIVLERKRAQISNT